MSSRIKTILLGRAVALSATEWDFTWSEKDDFILVANLKNLFIFKRPKRFVNADRTHKQDSTKYDKPFSWLFRKFHGFDPTEILSFNFQNRQAPRLKAGKVISITYESDRYSDKKQKYIHHFTKQPDILVDSYRKPDIFKIKGNSSIKITDRGILG